jgi:small subunit ribosomal protein S14
VPFSANWVCHSDREKDMPKLSQIVKQQRLRSQRTAGRLTFRSRYYNRCMRCGRSRGYYRKFDLCRICLRQLSLEGKIPGMTKSSW